MKEQRSRDEYLFVSLILYELSSWGKDGPRTLSMTPRASESFPEALPSPHHPSAIPVAGYYLMQSVMQQ